MQGELDVETSKVAEATAKKDGLGAAVTVGNF